MRHTRGSLFASYGLALTTIVSSAASAEDLPASATAPPGSVIVMRVDGAIGPATADYVHRALAQSAPPRAQLAVLMIDTPGGLDISMRMIIKDILASPVPVATFVAPSGARAASAGTYILYASHIAAMAPASNLGAATPVEIGLPVPGGQPDHPLPVGKPPDGKPASPSAPHADAMSAKRVADAAAYIRSLAQLRGRNADWAEKAVREAVSLSANEALKANVITLIARDVTDLLRQLDGREVRLAGGVMRLATQGATVIVLEADWRSRLLSVITDPSLALILMMIGVYGVVFEFMNPGFVLPGVIGAICLLLALFALQMLPISYAGLGLIALGLAFLVAEAFLPSVGVLGLGGIVAFAIGAVLLIDSDAPGLGIPLSLIALLIASSAIFIFFIVGMAAQARRRPIVSGSAVLIGATGELIEFVEGEGWALVQGVHWKVRGPAELHAGARVQVVNVQGLILEIAADVQRTNRGE